RYFEKRFVAKLYEHRGIIIYDVDERRLLKASDLPRRMKAFKRSPPEVPEKRLFPEPIYRLALTKDQVEVLKLLERLYERPEKGTKRVVIVTADRGRGKSSAIGMALAGLAHRIRRAKGTCRIAVTAPSEANVQELFKFARRGLERLNHEVEIEERQGLVVGVRAKGIEIRYFKPLEAVARRADLLAVDEAASLQVPMLFALLKRYDRVVYSSTIHGYEGAGRGFSVRFLRRLRRLKNVEVYEYEMEEPIRYSAGDPVEEWAFDTLLLDAEPATLDEEDVKCVEAMDVEYFVPDPEEFFLRDEQALREFFGIYIMAHYRNNPNDLGMMMDAPHHMVRALKLRTGKIVVSLELAEEGPLDEELARESSRGAWIMGNIIPDRLIKHYKLVDFGRFKGIRIVRIATHPELWGKGLGSRALKEVEKEARERGV
ncbi:MAG TPA: tRNA(Met) cytidine acetyltransferase, partial [Thermofilaceae archaeon]|nr:tRNA(Met) cytidine acetyltransferase [Thermofilaceae archaeon]